ncbi:MAG: hypothetical protein L0Z55_01240 [Planctomycetes bacterium]|nr:hypothetical protein [Planctomycetota bacterium]
MSYRSRAASASGLLAAIAIAAIVTTSALVAAESAAAPEVGAASETRHFNTRSIELDLAPVAAGAAPVRGVQLWYSTDGGQTWQAIEQVFDATAAISFEAPHDGRFGFRAVAVDGAGMRQTPPQPGDAPDYSCVIDTRAPAIAVHAPLPGAQIYAGTAIVLHWEADDEHLGDRPVAIEYRRSAEEPWSKIDLAECTAPHGRVQWFSPFVEGAIEVRFEARDLAGNAAEWVLDAPIAVTPFADFRGSRGMAAEPCSSFRKFPLFYRVQSYSPIEIGVVEIWFQKELGEWEVTEDPDQRSPFIFEAERDGVYCFYLRAVDRNGKGDRPEPGPDTPFDARVLVDTHSPDGELVVGNGAPELFHRAGEPIPISWIITEEHLAPGGCRLEVSIDDGATWLLLQDGLPSRDGRGVFTWRPPLIEVERLLFRLTARDLAANATAITSRTRFVLLNPAAEAKSTSAELHARALALAGRGDSESLALAIEKLDVAIQYDERNAAAWHDRGVLYTMLGDHALALADYLEAARRTPGDLGFKMSTVQGHLNLHRSEANHPREHFDAARDLFASVSRRDIYASEDYRTLLATYRALESELKEE